MKAKTLIAVLVIAFAAFSAPAAPVGIPILIDLSHKQPVAGVDVIIKMVPEAQWYVLVDSPEAAEALSPVIKNNAIVLIGDFSTIDLSRLRITMVIIGQPQAPLKPEEISALVAWFTEYPGRAIWVAADSDYPAQGSELSQHMANAVLEAIGARLRMDYVSVEDPVSNALRSYRVLGLANVSEIPVIRYGCERVLFHGPGAVAWVDDAGNWHPLTPDEKPDNTFIIVTTTTNGEIVEHQAEPTGTSGKAYKPGDTGAFTLMAAELVPVGKGYGVVIVSGESPYGGYQPIATWMYYGKLLTGPRFVRNVILWATGYLGELREYKKLAELPDQLKAEVTATLNQLKSDIESRMFRVESTVAGMASTINTAIALAAVALILAVAALALSFRKK